MFLGRAEKQPKVSWHLYGKRREEEAEETRTLVSWQGKVKESRLDRGGSL